MRTSSRLSRPRRSASASERAASSRSCSTASRALVTCSSDTVRRVRDDVVELAGDPVALLGLRPVGQPGLSCSAAARRGRARAGPAAAATASVMPAIQAAPARVGEWIHTPLDREEDNSASPVHQGIPACAAERAPETDQTHREPAELVEVAVPEHRQPGGRYRRGRQQGSALPLPEKRGTAADGRRCRRRPQPQGSGSAAGARLPTRTAKNPPAPSSAPIPPRARRDGTCPDRGS